MKKWIYFLGLIASFSCFANPWQGELKASTLFVVCFTPGGHCTDMIVNAINQSQHSIDVQAYSFTSKPIVSALINAAQRGVRVDVLLDKSNVRQPHSVVQQLEWSHIPFLIDSNPAIAHNKVMIIDHEKVITGSFNFTKNAQGRNAENALILRSPELAEYYEENFKRRKAASYTLSQYEQKRTKKNYRRHANRQRLDIGF